MYIVHMPPQEIFFILVAPQGNFFWVHLFIFLLWRDNKIPGLRKDARDPFFIYLKKFNSVKMPWRHHSNIIFAFPFRKFHPNMLLCSLDLPCNLVYINNFASYFVKRKKKKKAFDVKCYSFLKKDGC